MVNIANTNLCHLDIVRPCDLFMDYLRFQILKMLLGSGENEISGIQEVYAPYVL